MIKYPTIKPDVNKALYLAKRQLSELVTDAINLEGINITLPEVQTLLDGITIGGHKISDVTITLNQAEAWKFLFESIKNNTFSLSKDFANKLHSIAGKEEALEWGKFRTGNVTIAGTSFKPPAFEQLESKWDEMIREIESLENTIEKALVLFLQMARNQFYFDVNKRMGRFMMNAVLLQAGYPAINVPASRQLEFNKLMLEFYPSNNMNPMKEFLLNCWPQDSVDFMNQ